MFREGPHVGDRNGRRAGRYGSLGSRSRPVESEGADSTVGYINITAVNGNSGYWSDMRMAAGGRWCDDAFTSTYNRNL